MTELFEDDKIIAVSKPAGIPSHSLSDLEQITVESEMKKKRGDLPDLHLLHRLDTGTSGVLLFAKDKNTFLKMREKFKSKTIQKFYRAWSNANWSAILDDLPLRITLPLAHHPKNKKKIVVLVPNKKISFRGKAYPAETIIHGARKISGGVELEIQILTGVTHQIRAHLNHIGFPLIGDRIYNVQPTSQRLGLHAERVEFELDGVQYKITAPATFI